MLVFLSNNLFFYYISIFLLGLIIGSFLNVVIYRLPLMLQQQWRREAKLILNLAHDADNKLMFNLFLPSSHCPHCQQKLAVWQNIPLISYFKLKGKCYYCQQAINKRYPLVEVISAILSLIIAYHFGLSVSVLFALIFTWALLILMWIDIEHRLLPDHITVSLLWLGLLINLNGVFTDIFSAVVGAATGYVVLWLMAWIFQKITGKIGMGHGDFKLLAAFGAWFGWQLLPFILLIAAVSGTVMSLLLFSFKKQQRDTFIPFGPYLALAGWCVLLWCQPLLSVYLNN